MVTDRTALRLTRATIGLLAGETVLVVVLSVAGRAASVRHAATLGPSRAVTASLKLSSLALWSETSYARSPGLAEPIAPMATHPSALEPFPAGSLVPPDRPSSGTVAP